MGYGLLSRSGGLCATAQKNREARRPATGQTGIEYTILALKFSDSSNSRMAAGVMSATWPPASPE
ncbi:MAG: hypothetical protein E6H04_13190 [Bacillati bacterium ANGP1]|uniref:Uncharacterized protein n=1 Tax=Candidatus Segetimicrobium genomatis TaxID=2569760 RepID=A0A537J3B1_9BACT|nr:MAG: hypothetical protein E6H04_13190 [Terrabacteria group bacterium ANGP1]